jgi:hypothetical protein
VNRTSAKNIAITPRRTTVRMSSAARAG